MNDLNMVFLTKYKHIQKKIIFFPIKLNLIAKCFQIFNL